MSAKQDLMPTSDNSGTPRRRRGRPTKYRPEFAEQAYKLCLLGASDAQLAAFFEINEDTITEWKRKHPDFSGSVKGGKLAADAEVAAALYKRAIGFTYEEETYEKILTEDQKDEEITQNRFKKKVVKKMVVPDTGAAMNWLKNRQKELWRDNIDIDFNKLSDTQLDYMIEQIMKKHGHGQPNE